MIIFFEAGRLGNQLFQYCALKKSHKGSIFLIGMQSLKNMFTGLEVAGGTKLGWLFERLIRRLGKDRLYFLAKKLRVIGFVVEQETEKGLKVKMQKGFLYNVYYCETSFFQSENMIDKTVTEKIMLKPELLDQALNIFMNLHCEKAATFFVHVRRGDYIYWPSRSAPAVLPFRWYQEQMNLIRSKYKTPFFIIITDDVPYVNEMFSISDDIFVSNESEGIDFALMSFCQGGILSASSFSWWAAYFAHQVNNKGYFIAPLYWAGHRNQVWVPKGIQTSWLRYVEVQ